MDDLTILKDKHSPAETTSQIGERGEYLANSFLRRKGYRIVCANFKAPVGRNNRGVTLTGEIDLIGYDGNVLCMIEVKTRKSAQFASPLAAVDLRKQRQIIRTSRAYRKLFHLRVAQIRFDVVSVILSETLRPRIELIKDFFSEDKFRKKYWSGER